MSTKTLSALVAAIATVAFVGPAAAQSRTWNFGDTAASPAGSCAGGSTATSTNYVASSGPTGTTAASFGNFWNCSQQGVGGATTLSVQAYSTTNNSSGAQVTSGSGTHFATAAVNYHGTGSGIGVANRVEGATVTTEPNHAMDNSTPGVDLLQLNFDSAQVLKSVKLGWAGDDGDFQILAWTGSDPASRNIVGKTAANLVAPGGGWSLVATVNGTEFNGVEYKAGTDWTTNLGVSSSYWLISAFNSGFGGSAPTGGIDAMKVLSVGTDAGAVPIPGTLALAGLGMLMAAGTRRRKAQQG